MTAKYHWLRGSSWNVSIYQKIPAPRATCPRTVRAGSRRRATLPNVQASQKAPPQRTKGATPMKKMALNNLCLTVKSRKKQKSCDRNLRDEECWPGAVSI